MDKTEAHRRWQAAEEHKQAAETLYVKGLYRACVSRGYYACYQAMWVALGDPPTGAWRHGGIAQQFCRGRWADPVLIPTSLTSLLKRLLALYDLRLDADYRALSVAAEKAQDGLDTTNDVFQLIIAHKAI
jgi:uncharacterized protein (UPF0332 family)